MYVLLGHVTGALILIAMLALAATLSGAAAMGVGHDRVTFDIAKLTKRAFLTLLVACSFVLAAMAATAWYGWREGVFDGVDKRLGSREAGVGAEYGQGHP